MEEDVELKHWATDLTMNYHEKQFLLPKRSTVAFEKFLSSHVDLNGKVLDLCCGGGAVDAYLAEKNPNINITGVDIIEESFNLFN